MVRTDSAILELPTGSRISSERFTEFDERLLNTIKVQKAPDKQIESERFAQGNKPLVLTEGPLDVRYIQTALTLLGKGELLDSFDIEFVGIERGKSSRIMEELRG